MKLFVLIISIILTVGCKNPSRKNADRYTFETSLPSDSLLFYFPSILSNNVKNKKSIYQDFKQKWYSSSLYSLKEPILYTKNDSQTIYRLLWLRSFHQPVCFSMTEHNGSNYLSAKMLDKQPAFYPTTEEHSVNDKTFYDTIRRSDRLAFITFDTTITLQEKQWNAIENYLSNSDFWNSPAIDPEDMAGADGSNWILEGRKNKKYHFIDRRNGEDELIALGKQLIQISGLKMTEDEVY